MRKVSLIWTALGAILACLWIVQPSRSAKSRETDETHSVDLTPILTVAKSESAPPPRVADKPISEVASLVESREKPLGGRSGWHPDYKHVDDEAPSLDDFVASRPKDLRAILKASVPFRGFRTAWVGVLGSDLAGKIHVGGDELEIRYSISPQFDPEVSITPESCLALRLPSGEEILSTVADGSLKVLEAPFRSAHIFVTNERHFFYILNCRGTTQICDTWPGVRALYYLKQDDGQIFYQGEAQWETYGSEIYHKPSSCPFHVIYR